MKTKKRLNIVMYLLLSIFIFSCNNSTDQAKENDENWINTNDIQVYFSPNQNIDLIMIKEIEKAKTKISVAIYDITNKKITDALINAHKKGISIRLYTDKIINNDYEQPLLDDLEANNIEVKVANPENWSNVQAYRAIMHNKFIVIDEDIVITGSYNFTTNAEENNRENLIIIPNKIIAKKYYEQFNIYWDNP